MEKKATYKATIKGYILTVVLLGMLGTTKGQEYDGSRDADQKDRLVIVLAGTNDLGDEGQLESVILSLRGDSIVAIQGIYKESATEKDLSPGVVRQLFGQEAPRLRPPFIPDLWMKNIHAWEDVGGRYGIEQVRIYRDSTVYIYAPGYKPHTYVDPAIRYTGDVVELEAAIARDLARASRDMPVDSFLVYEAFIQGLDIPSKTVFEIKGLIYGKPSHFSWTVLSHLTARKTGYFDDGRPKWEPLTEDKDSPKTVRFRIEAILNPDGNVTVKLPGQ